MAMTCDFFSVRCEQAIDEIPRSSDQRFRGLDFERAGYSLACQIFANQDRDLLPDILEEAIEDCTRYFEEQGLVSACEKTAKRRKTNQDSLCLVVTVAATC